MIEIISVAIFLIGCFFGSFLNLLIDRLPKDEDVLTSRSHCDSCGKTLSAMDLIPVISFFWVKGKCRYCRAPFSYFYPFMEILTGILFVFIFLFVSNDLRFTIYDLRFWVTIIYYLSFSSSLIVIFFTDLRSGIIPNKVLIFLSAVTLLYQLVFQLSALPNHLMSAFISLAFFLFLSLITKGRGMGFGDVKFSFVLGLILGFPSFILGLYVAFLTGATCSIILILCGKKRLRADTIPFGPFLVVGLFVALYFGESIIPKVLHFLIP